MNAPTLHSTAVLRAVCRRGANGTVLAERYTAAPLKLAKSFRDDTSDGLCLYMMDCSPGMLEGDRYEIDMKLEEQTRLVLTNQSFTKIHPAQQHPSVLRQHFRLAQGAVLEYMPEPSIPYADSRFDGASRFELEQGASLMVADVWTPGRTHRGEQFRFHSVSNRLEVYRGNRLIAWDHYRLEPGRHHYAGPGAMEHYTHNASLWLFDERAHEQALLERLRALLQQPGRDGLLAAASHTAEQGLVVRMLGRDVWRLQALIQLLWDECRDYVWKLPPCRLRK